MALVLTTARSLFLTHHAAKFSWTTGDYAAFNTLKSALLGAPILHYPDPLKCYIVYTDASKISVNQ